MWGLLTPSMDVEASTWGSELLRLSLVRLGKNNRAPEINTLIDIFSELFRWTRWVCTTVGHSRERACARFGAW